MVRGRSAPPTGSLPGCGGITPSSRDPLAGFSLLEMLVVLSLLAIFLAMVLPSYSHYASNQRALSVAHTLASDLQVAEQEAVTRRAAVAVRISPTDAACPGGPVASYVVSEGETVIKRACFPSDVAWAVPQSELLLQPTGVPPTGLTLTVRSTRTGKRFMVAAAAGTGMVTDDPR